LRVFRLYRKLCSYKKVADALVEEGIWTATYVSRDPEDARREVRSMVKDARRLINGGYKKLR